MFGGTDPPNARRRMQHREGVCVLAVLMGFSSLVRGIEHSNDGDGETSPVRAWFCRNALPRKRSSRPTERRFMGFVVVVQ